VNIYDAFLLGLVQGLTEFLPVSSSGHLVFFQDMLGIDFPGITLEVMAHLGTFLSVLVVFWPDLLKLLAGSIKGDSYQQRFLFLLVVGSLPTAAMGLALRPLFSRAFQSSLLVGFMLIITGLLLWSIIKAPSGRKRINEMHWSIAVVVGIAQGVAILPGISRSGSTITACLWQGLKRAEAVRYSFILPLPAIFGAFLFECKDVLTIGVDLGSNFFLYAVAALTAFLVGIAAIKVFINMLENRRFHYFAYYCWVLGAAIILFNLF